MTNDRPKQDQMPDFSGVTGGASTSATTRDGKPVHADVSVSETYVVVSGDSLSRIAKQKYGNAKLWRTIYEANREVINDPDLIQAGWRLRIPAKPTA